MGSSFRRTVFAALGNVGLWRSRLAEDWGAPPGVLERIMLRRICTTKGHGPHKARLHGLRRVGALCGTMIRRRSGYAATAAM